ncbi:MAG TPA: translation elongation factor Ts [Candidatus Doudnabacteria bacterium]|nr:translation elongation factor Ts [Candidatus Doudnabacteria bacterium]
MSNDLIKQLREQTGAGIMDVKEALEEADGDQEVAIEILRKKGLAKQAKKADRAANEGIVESYIHAGGRIGVLVEVNCETDFVARTDEFKNLVKEIALHIAASNPLYISAEDVPTEVIEKEKEIYKEQVGDKPADVLEKMLEGKVAKYLEEVCLLNQPFVKDGDKTVGELLGEATGKMGENIQVRRFARFMLGN